ncbi:MAG TPA: hypothetical protein ENJ44_00175 [Oceanospirillales bacterium]|nr:hypothetical protein [Oceanospirillales bacterium]
MNFSSFTVIKNIKKYFTSLFVIGFVLLFCSVVALFLTQQRIQLEAANKLNNIKLKQSPWRWDFVDFSDDVVESFQNNWQKKPDLAQIIALKGQNPQLSLNFSGETINARLHDFLTISAAKNMQGSIRLQVKTKLSDQAFYYSQTYRLKGKSVQLDLHKNWLKIDKNNTKTAAVYAKDIPQISSLVLLFSNPKTDLVLNSVELAYNQDLVINDFTIDCDGKNTSKDLNKNIDNKIAVFHLAENCLFPSNYLWLKQGLQQQYPESILRLKQKLILAKPTLHKVNLSYTSIFWINFSLYALISIALLLVLFITVKNKVEADSSHEKSWLKQTIFYFLKKGAKKTITPYHLMLNYAVVLIPTVIIFGLMTIFKMPTINNFQHLPVYFIWAIIQQYVLGTILAENIFYKHTHNRLLAALLAATVFSLLHLPSVRLMLATFIAAGFWSYAWLVFGRLLPLALSHAVLALMFYAIISPQYLYSAKVLQWFWE